MGNSNEPTARYISEEELDKIIKLELKQKKQKLKKQIRGIKIIDNELYTLAWDISFYKHGGYGNKLGRYPHNGKYTQLTNIFLVRTIYFWYSNSKC